MRNRLWNIKQKWQYAVPVVVGRDQAVPAFWGAIEAINKQSVELVSYSFMVTNNYYAMTSLLSSLQDKFQSHGSINQVLVWDMLATAQRGVSILTKMINQIDNILSLSGDAIAFINSLQEVLAHSEATVHQKMIDAHAAADTAHTSRWFFIRLFSSLSYPEPHFQTDDIQFTKDSCMTAVDKLVNIKNSLKEHLMMWIQFVNFLNQYQPLDGGGEGPDIEIIIQGYDKHLETWVFVSCRLRAQDQARRNDIFDKPSKDPVPGNVVLPKQLSCAKE